MTYQEFGNASRDDLVKEVDQCFLNAHLAGGLDKPAYLLQAQFFMQELDRRHDSKWIWVSFVCELVIIALIVGEIAVNLAKH
jgi:hypothetical protein